jgi:putative ABC transport system substrate-binding protein
MIGRREFITLFGGAAAWPVRARAQQGDRMRRVGVLMTALSETDPEAQARIKVLKDGLRRMGWIADRNLQIDYRFGDVDPNVTRMQASELVGLAPDVILAHTSPALLSLQKMTRTIPIVFVQVVDPVGNGFVESLARPGGNVTGFVSFEYSIAAKWIELLKIIAPRVSMVAIIRDASLASGVGQMAVIQAVAQSIGVELRPVGMSDIAEIEVGIDRLAREPNAGVIMTAHPAAAAHRERIITLMESHRLPAVYFYRYFVRDGGLISYGVDILDLWHSAAGYLDRILKGAKPGDLPVQAPTKYELAINLKTAKTLGLDVPDSLLARADEVIE